MRYIHLFRAPKSTSPQFMADNRQDERDWYKHRPYPHFDRPVKRKEAEQFVTDSDWVEDYNFYPFIKRIDQEERYRELDEPTREKKGEVTYKSRRICYAAHLDAHVYAYYSHLLSDQYEEHIASKDFNRSVVAYRRFDEPKCNIHFARDIFRFIYQNCAQNRSLVALAFDIKGFFDNLDHGHLKTEWGRVLGDPHLPEDHYQLYTSLTKFAYVKERRLREVFPDFYDKSRKERARKQICPPHEFRQKVRGEGHVIVNRHSYGIPQGTPISALLSNIYMRPFDRAVYDKIDDLDGIYRRYSDDLIVVVPKDRKEVVRHFVMDQISDLELVIQPKKTEEYRFTHDGARVHCRNLDENARPDVPEDNQLQYLGFVFDGEHIRIRPSSLTRFYRRMNGAVKVEANRALRNPLDISDPTIRRSRLYERFSHKGKRNFVQYAYRAADIMKEVNGRDDIRPQVARHWKVLHDRIDEWETWVNARVVAREWSKACRNQLDN